MKRIKVCSLDYARRLLDTGDFNALVSIGHPRGDEHVLKPWPDYSLSLGFYDSTPYRGKGRPLFSGEDGISLINFARRLPDDVSLLVHCKRGRSRSSAAALICLVARGHNENTAIFDYLLPMAPKSNPNGWMLRVADAIMGSRLFDACHAAGIVKWIQQRDPATAAMFQFAPNG